MNTSTQLRLQNLTNSTIDYISSAS